MNAKFITFYEYTKQCKHLHLCKCHVEYGLKYQEMKQACIIELNLTHAAFLYLNKLMLKC